MDRTTHPQIGYYITQLMLGANEFSDGQQQGLVWPNGTWFDPAERACLAAPIPPMPPLPPGPQPPFKNFTVGGMAVGLRDGARTVQVLSPANDTRWFGNFSFVPHLFSWAYPPMPNRSNPGAHHLGDLTLRVQPAAETNTSLWATYSSAMGGFQTVNPAVTPDPYPANTFDIANITPSLLADGQIDTRFPLGLEVLRAWERWTAPDGTTEALQMTFTITATGPDAVRIGGLGMTLPADTTWGGLNTEEVGTSNTQATSLIIKKMHLFFVFFSFSLEPSFCFLFVCFFFFLSHLLFFSFSSFFGSLCAPRLRRT